MVGSTSDTGSKWRQALLQALVPVILGLIALYQANRIEAIRYDTALAIEAARSESSKELQELANKVETAQLNLTASIESSKLELAQSQFDAEEKARRNTILQTYVPYLLSGDSSQIEVAVAILLVTYPEDAKNIIDTVASARGPEYQAILAPQIQLAGQVQAATGPWIVVVANELEYLQAAKHPPKLEGFGYSSAIYTIEGYFVIAIGPFPSETDAERALISIRAQVSRGAYTLNLSESCPYRKQVPMDSGPGYFECTLRGPLGN
jgi:hypothetical protein